VPAYRAATRAGAAVRRRWRREVCGAAGDGPTAMEKERGGVGLGRTGARFPCLIFSSFSWMLVNAAWEAGAGHSRDRRLGRVYGEHVGRRRGRRAQRRRQGAGGRV